MSHEMPYHIPALLRPTVDLLVTDPDGIYVDCTMGGAGHTRAILEKLSPKGRLLGFDQDADARRNIPDDPRFTFVHANFRYLHNFLRFYATGPVDGILADLGVSFHHFDDAERGFSFREDAPLDMRMNREMDFTAADFLANLSEEELREAFVKYTDLKNQKKLIQAIVSKRVESPIETTGQLAGLLEPVLNPKNYKKDLAQVFQMLRIMVNGEMRALEDLMEQAPYALKPGGRLAILSYHSGEDRIIKNFIKTGNAGGVESRSAAEAIYGMGSSPWNRVTRSPITPSEDEVEANPRSRSAKLRVAERNNNPINGRE